MRGTAHCKSEQNMRILSAGRERCKAEIAALRSEVPAEPAEPESDTDAATEG